MSTLIFDTNVVEKIDKNNIISSKKIKSELEHRDVNACFVNSFHPAEAKEECVNNIISSDIEKINSRLASSSINKDLYFSREFTGSLRRTSLERIWNNIPDKFVKQANKGDWLHEQKNAEADCSLITLAKEMKAPIYTQDNALLTECTKELGSKFCVSPQF